MSSLYRTTAFVENFIVAHPDVSLAHTEYCLHFFLSGGANILASPSQRVRTFVEYDESPYRFIIVGELASFKVVDCSVSPFFFYFFYFSLVYRFICSSIGNKFGHFLSVNLGELRYPSILAEIFKGQMATLRRIETRDNSNEHVHVQVWFPFYCHYPFQD